MHEMKKSSGDIHMNMYIWFSQAGEIYILYVEIIQERHY